MKANHDAAQLLRSAYTHHDLPFLAEASEHLPPEAVRGLARDVVGQLAQRHASVSRLDPRSDIARIAQLTTALLGDDPAAALGIAEDLLREGVAVEALYQVHIAGAARKLGTLWDEDRVSFVEVSVAAGRIFSLLRAIRRMLPVPPGDGRRRAVFATVPGEDHAVGVEMAADIFRRRGWDIALLIGLGHDALMSEVRKLARPIVAVSAGGFRSHQSLARTVVGLHLILPPVLVMVSGHITIEDPAFVSQIGADAIANDIPEAVRGMDGFCRTLAISAH